MNELKLLLSFGWADFNVINSKNLNLSSSNLISFTYFKDQDLNRIHKANILKNHYLMIDSGAFTLQKLEHIDEQTVDKYVEDYIRWLKKNYDYWDNYVEMDIDNIIPYKKVKEIRHYLWDCIGEPPIVVWHGLNSKLGFDRTLNDWKDYCQKFKYVGFGREIDYRYIQPMLDYAHKNKTLVHGFAITSMNDIFRFNFDSVDSSSWVNSCRFGDLIVYNKDKLITLNKYRAQPQKTNYFRNWSFVEWSKLQNRLEVYWKLKPKPLYI